MVFYALFSFLNLAVEPKKSVLIGYSLLQFSYNNLDRITHSNETCGNSILNKKSTFLRNRIVRLLRLHILILFSKSYIRLDHFKLM